MINNNLIMLLVLSAVFLTGYFARYIKEKSEMNKQLLIIIRLKEKMINDIKLMNLSRTQMFNDLKEVSDLAQQVLKAGNELKIMEANHGKIR